MCTVSIILFYLLDLVFDFIKINSTTFIEKYVKTSTYPYTSQSLLQPHNYTHITYIMTHTHTHIHTHTQTHTKLKSGYILERFIMPPKSKCFLDICNGKYREKKNPTLQYLFLCIFFFISDYQRRIKLHKKYF